MAALEEWLQQEYVKYYDEADYYDNKPELLASKNSGLFLKLGSQNYIVSSLGGSVAKYYLINKSNLPKEVREQLAGGNSTEYVDFANFIDVYGVTEDLKVYYCDNGISSSGTYGNVAGISIDSKAKLKKINQNEAIKTAISKKLGLEVGEDITVGDIQSLKDLELSDSSITTLDALSEAYSLKTIKLENLSLENLSGLENCTMLEKISFYNSTIGDYSELCNHIKLQEIYLYLPSTTMDKDTANDQVKYLSLGLKDADKLTKVTRLGISGDKTLIESPKSLDKGEEYSVSETYISNLDDISYMSQINSSIQGTVKYLFLNNNKITNIDSIDGFNDLLAVGLMNNNQLTNLNGLNNDTALNYVYAYNCYSSNSSVVNRRNSCNLFWTI